MTSEAILFLMLCKIVTFLFLFWSPDIDGQFAFSGVLSPNVFYYLYNKRCYVCLSVCLSVSMFRMAGQTAEPIETKLDTRTHVQPGSVSGKVNVKVIHECVRE